MTEQFRHLLEEGHDFPCEFTFRFIVPQAKVGEVEALFAGGAEFEYRPSSAGKYVRIAVRVRVESAESVMATFERSKTIEGLIGL